MKINNNIVYFEDSDSIKEIKDFFKNINTKEKEIEIKEYGSLSLKSLNLKEIIEQIENFKFNTLNNDEINKIKSLLKREEEGQNNEFENLYIKKLTAGISLIDYIIRNYENIPHHFKYIKTNDGYVGYADGEFKNEISEMQIIAGENPISFYSYKEKNKLPHLNFSEDLNKNMKIIKLNFLADIETKEFNTIVKEYVNFKELINKKNARKNLK